MSPTQASHKKKYGHKEEDNLADRIALPDYTNLVKNIYNNNIKKSDIIIHKKELNNNFLNLINNFNCENIFSPEGNILIQCTQGKRKQFGDVSISTLVKKFNNSHPITKYVKAMRSKENEILATCELNKFLEIYKNKKEFFSYMMLGDDNLTSPKFLFIKNNNNKEITKKSKLSTNIDNNWYGFVYSEVIDVLLNVKFRQTNKSNRSGRRIAGDFYVNGSYSHILQIETRNEKKQSDQLHFWGKLPMILRILQCNIKYITI